MGVQDAISGAVGDAGDAPMNETAVANETMSAVNETMSMVDGVKDFVGNVSDCGLNATEEGNCTNATMPADGEMTGEEAGDDAGAVDDDGGAGDDSGEGDDGRRKLLDLTDAAGAVTDAAGTVSDAAGTVTDAVTGAVSGDGMMTDMNATMNGTMMNGTEMANDTIGGEAGDDSVAGDDAGAVDDDGGAGDDSGEGDDGRRKLSTIRKLFA